MMTSSSLAMSLCGTAVDAVTRWGRYLKKTISLGPEAHH